jgi:hypothetical protein
VHTEGWRKDHPAPADIPDVFLLAPAHQPRPSQNIHDQTARAAALMPTTGVYDATIAPFANIFGYFYWITHGDNP